jgi:hypothetical protein
MSALTPKADIDRQLCHVCFVPIADSCSAAKLVFDRLVSAGKHGDNRVRDRYWRNPTDAEEARVDLC